MRYDIGYNAYDDPQASVEATQLAAMSDDQRIGGIIYMTALSDRRGFRDDQIGIEDEAIWAEIFAAIGKAAREALSE